MLRRLAKRVDWLSMPPRRELGYVAIDDQHRGQRLSHGIVAALLTRHTGPLVAATV